MPSRVTSVGVTRHGAVLIARVVGFYTREVAQQARDRVNAEIERAGAARVLLDLRASACLMSDEDWGSVARDFARNPTRAPLAVLVNESQLQVAMQRCLPLSDVGRARVSYSDLERAASWAGIPESALSPFRSFAPVTPLSGAPEWGQASS